MRKDLNHFHKINSTRGCIAFKKFFLDKLIKNNDKLNKVLIIIDFWFITLENFYNNEGKSGLSQLEVHLKKNKHFNLHDAITLFYNKEYNPKISIKNKFFINTFLKLYFNIFFNNKEIVISGGEGKFSKLHDLLSNFWIRKHINNTYVPDYLSNIRKKEFLLKLKNEKKYDKHTFEFIENNIPIEFFILFNEKKIFNRKILLFGSPYNFLVSKKYLKFFSNDNDLIVNGTMHGSGYGQFKSNLNEIYEIKFSSKYTYWFPFNKSKHIGRFVDTNNKKEILNKKIYWVSRSTMNKHDIFTNPDFYKHNIELNHLNEIDKILSNFNDCVFTESPKGDFGHWKPKYVKSHKFSSKLENHINKNFNILIFDNLTSTLMYFCLKFRVPFLIFVNDIDENIFSINFLNFINCLKKNEILFLKGQSKDFQNKLSQIYIKEGYYKHKRDISRLIDNY